MRTAVGAMLFLSPLLLAGQDAPPRAHEVPAIQGKSVSVARQLARLADLHFVLGTFYISPDLWRDDIQPGVVGMQAPQPRFLAPAGSPLAAWIFVKANTEQKLIEMPDLRGLPWDKAATRVKESGLVLMQGLEATNQEQVQDQFPRAGQKVFEQTSVFLQTKSERGVRNNGRER